MERKKEKVRAKQIQKNSMFTFNLTNARVPVPNHKIVKIYNAQLIGH